MLRSITIFSILFLLLQAGCKQSDNGPTGPAPIIDSFSPASAQAGEKVTITGKNFTTSPKVFFNDIPGAISGTPTDNSIIAIVPANTSTGKIKVSSNNQTVLSSTDFILKYEVYFAVQRSDQGVGFISSLNSNMLVSAQGFEVPQPALTPTPPISVDWIMDAVIYDNRIYVVRGSNSSVDIVDVPALTLVKSIPFRKKASDLNLLRHIEFVDGRIFVLDVVERPPFDFETFLKAINPDTGKVDSVSLGLNVCYTMAQSADKVFVSRQLANFQRSILVFDALTLAVVGELSKGSKMCTMMLTDKNNNVLAFNTDGTMATIDAKSLSIISEQSVGVAANAFLQQYPGGAYNNLTVALDKDSNILYYLALAAQPASAPFILRKYDLNTNVGSNILNNFVSGTTISFDQKNKYILIGDIYPGATVKVLGIDGGLKKQIGITSTPTEILVW